MPGSCIISTENLLATASAAGTITTTDGTVAALTAATGYAVADLYDGKVERAFRSGVSQATHQIVFSTSSGMQPSFVYLGDATPPSGKTIVSAHLYSGASETGAWTSTVAIPLNSRGDGWRIFPAAVASKYWKVEIVLSAAGVIDVGEVWLGSYVSLPKTFTTITRDPQRNTVVNESSAGTRFRARFGPKRERFGLEFSPLNSTQNDAVAAVVEAADGGYNNVVLAPDATNPAGGYHGTFEDASTSSEDASRLHAGRSLLFTESARAI